MQNYAYQWLARRIQALCGLNYLHQLDTLEGKIAKRLAELGLSPLEYGERLSRDARELDKAIELLTINETYFYREESQFELFREEILPQWRREHARRPLRIWSAACSTGDEPYTLAMMVMESGLYGPGEVEILATDINKKVLLAAQRGWYPERSLSFRRIPSRLLERYFDRTAGGYQLRDSIRRMVQFKQLNLLDQAAVRAMGPVDLIFCRNVLIYFDAPTTQQVVSGFWDILQPDGSLFLGHAESIIGLNLPFRTIQAGNAFYYRKEVTKCANTES